MSVSVSVIVIASVNVGVVKRRVAGELFGERKRIESSRVRFKKRRSSPQMKTCLVLYNAGGV